MHHFKTLMSKLLIELTVALLVHAALTPPPPLIVTVPTIVIIHAR